MMYSHILAMLFGTKTQAVDWSAVKEFPLRTLLVSEDEALIARLDDLFPMMISVCL